MRFRVPVLGKLTARRTFLSWLHFAVVLGGLAVGLLNFGGTSVTRLVSAGLYTLIGEYPGRPLCRRVEGEERREVERASRTDPCDV